jgi:putative addiction module component (TIGR02574 family)
MMYAETARTRFDGVADAGGARRAGTRLSADERARLVEILLESLREAPLAEIEAAWDREIAERVAAFDRGETETYSADEVFAAARRLVE